MIKAIPFILHTPIYKAPAQGFISDTSKHYSFCHSFKWPEITPRHTHNQEEQKAFAVSHRNESFLSFSFFQATKYRPWGHKGKSWGGGESEEEVKETDRWTCRERWGRMKMSDLMLLSACQSFQSAASMTGGEGENLLRNTTIEWSKMSAQSPMV